MAAHTAEGMLVGLWEGKTTLGSILRIGVGSIADILSVGVILGVGLTPFFAFKALERALGTGALHSLRLARRSEIGSRLKAQKPEVG